MCYSSMMRNEYWEYCWQQVNCACTAERTCVDRESLVGIHSDTEKTGVGLKINGVKILNNKSQLTQITSCKVEQSMLFLSFQLH